MNILNNKCTEYFIQTRLLLDIKNEEKRIKNY